MSFSTGGYGMDSFDETVGMSAEQLEELRQDMAQPAAEPSPQPAPTQRRTPYVRASRPHRSQGSIDDLGQDVEPDYVNDSDYASRGGLTSGAGYRRSRSDMRQLRRDLHYGQYLEIPKGRRDIFASRERKSRIKSVLALIVVAAILVAAAYFAVRWVQQNVPFMAADMIVRLAFSLI